MTIIYWSRGWDPARIEFNWKSPLCRTFHQQSTSFCNINNNNKWQQQKRRRRQQQSKEVTVANNPLLPRDTSVFSAVAPLPFKISIKVMLTHLMCTSVDGAGRGWMEKESVWWAFCEHEHFTRPNIVCHMWSDMWKFPHILHMVCARALRGASTTVHVHERILLIVCCSWVCWCTAIHLAMSNIPHNISKPELWASHKPATLHRTLIGRYLHAVHKLYEEYII